MKLFYTISFFIFASILSSAQDSSRLVKILEGRIQIEIPSGLHPMTAQEFQFKYHKPNTTAAAYADKNLELNLIVSYQESIPVHEDQLYDIIPPMVEQMKKKMPTVKILSQGAKIIGGHKYSFLKFISQGEDQPIFNYQLYGSLDKKLIMFVLNCPAKMKPDWDPEAETMWNTIVVKK